MRNLMLEFIALTILASGAFTQEELPSRMTYRLDKAKANLDQAEQSQKAGQTKAALQSLGYAKDELKTAMDSFAGKFDPKHPILLELQNRIAALDASLGQAQSESKGLAEALPGLLKALEENFAALQKAYSDASLALSSIDTAPAKVDALRLTWARLRDQQSLASAFSRDFRQQVPDMTKLMKLGDQGPAILMLLEALDALGPQISSRESTELKKRSQRLSDLVARSQAHIDEKSENLTAFATLAEQDLQSLDQESSILSAILRPPSEESPHSPQEMAAQESLSAAQDMAVALRKAQLEAKGQAIDEARLRIASARFPKSSLSGKAWEALSAEMKEAYLAWVNKDREVVRSQVAEDWNEQTVAFWENDVWVVRHRRFATGYLGAKLADGRAHLPPIPHTVSPLRSQFAGGLRARSASFIARQQRRGQRRKGVQNLSLRLGKSAGQSPELEFWVREGDQADS